MEYVIALDLGSSSVKAEAFGPGAVSLTHARVAPKLRAGVLWMDAVQTAAEHAVYLLQQQVQGAAKAIVFSAAMHQMMAVDAQGQPLTPVWSWDDQRASEEAHLWTSRADARSWWQATGTPLLPLNPFFKLLWLRKNDLATWDKAAWFCSPKEYLLWKWFGIKVLDYSLASACGMMHSRHGKWYEPALKALELDPDRLSMLVAPEEGITVSTGFCDFNITRPFRVFPGGSDGTLANLGCGSDQPDTAVLTIGTSGAYRVNTDLQSAGIATNYFHYHQTLAHKVSGGATNNGGNAFQHGWRWLGFPELSSSLWNEHFEHAALRFQGRPSGSVLKPYFLGERAPVVLNDARPELEAGLAVEDQETATWLIAEGVLRNLLAIREEIHRWTPAPQLTYLSGGFFKLPGMTTLAEALWPTPVTLVPTEDVSTRGAYLLIQDQVE